MQFIPLKLQGAYLIKLELKKDERGHFARTFCVNEFSAEGLSTHFLQCSTSFNLKKGLIRGMHFQSAPFAETKLVRCTKGKIWDVIVDLRETSSTYYEWYGVELSENNGHMLYIPKGFAHGYQVLADESEVFYMMDELYNKDAAREISPYTLTNLTWPLSVLSS